MTAPLGEVPPSLQPDPIPDTTVRTHAIVPTARTPWSVGHTEENAKFDTPSTTPILTDSGLDVEGKNIPHPGPETSVGRGDVENGKRDPKSSWKNALLGSTNSTLEAALAKFTQTEEGMEIKLPDNLMDKIISSLHLAIIGRFFSFRPSIDMIKRWAKSRWKLKGEEDWCNITRAKYLDREQFHYNLSTVDLPQGSKLWNNILKSRLIVREGLKWQLGNGRKVRFWEDIWAEDRPLANTRFHQIMHHLKGLLGDYIVDYMEPGRGGWRNIVQVFSNRPNLVPIS
ncbi:hypothetical protein SUGI_0945370 [Cryptomeria japonica]|nr:hypothetical protein SUGI_0945370 [Cryptomeria japonica]